MSMKNSYIAKTLAGKTLEYSSRQALNHAKTRRRDVIVDSWPAGDGPPKRINDASAWDAWRLRRGYA